MSQKISEYLIQDCNGLGFGFFNEQEGWVFTVLPSLARRFDTKEEANRVRREHFSVDETEITRIIKEKK